jgi:hypothetical protein
MQNFKEIMRKAYASLMLYKVSWLKCLACIWEASGSNLAGTSTILNGILVHFFSLSR